MCAKKLMYPLLAMAMFAGGTVSSAQCLTRDQLVRVPFQPQDKIEKKAVRKLHHVRELLMLAKKELREAQIMREYKDLDWVSMEKSIGAATYRLSDFLFPVQHLPNYPGSWCEEGDAALLQTSTTDEYPNGEDLAN